MGFQEGNQGWWISIKLWSYQTLFIFHDKVLNWVWDLPLGLHTEVHSHGQTWVCVCVCQTHDTGWARMLFAGFQNQLVRAFLFPLGVAQLIPVACQHRSWKWGWSIIVLYSFEDRIKFWVGRIRQGCPAASPYMWHRNSGPNSGQGTGPLPSLWRGVAFIDLFV